MKKPEFQVFKSKDNGQWYFRLVATNSRTICQSEGYTQKVNALNGIKSVKKNAGKAKVEEYKA